MKIAYIGSCDDLAAAMVERMSQEGHDVYLLSDEDLPQKKRKRQHYRFFRTPIYGQNFEELLRSIDPDYVIFAGNYLTHTGASASEEESDMILLARTLRALADSPGSKIIFLSSTEVYGNTTGFATEQAALTPVTERGVRFVREEQLLEIYRSQHQLAAVMLRVSQVYSDHVAEASSGFLGRAFAFAFQPEISSVNDTYQPVHVADLAEAIKRVIAQDDCSIYNISGSDIMTSQELYSLICSEESIEQIDVHWEESADSSLANSAAIRQELDWREFHHLPEELQKGEIEYVRKELEVKEKRKVFPKPVRQTIENIVLFAVFFALSYICAPYEPFSQISWLMIYVIMVSISYNIYQSTFAAILAAFAYPYLKHLGMLQLATFNFYAGAVLEVMEFFFLGLMVSYTTNTLRGHIQRLRKDNRELQEECQELKVINEENVLIKNEYEERVLASSTGFPKLYDLIGRLMIQEPDRILMETMEVISELIKTKTVAVYQGTGDSPWFRLVGALSENSAMEGKSWNVSESPEIYAAVKEGKLYQGEFGSDEPAIVLPIVIDGQTQAVVLIKKLPFESESLYTINILKTLGLLLSDSMEKALQYEEFSRSNNYIDGTEVLKPKAFYERLSLAQEKADKSVAEYSVVALSSPEPLEKIVKAANQVLRTTDYIGADNNGELYALLNNMGYEGLDHVIKRLHECGISAVPVRIKVGLSGADAQNERP